MNNSITLGVVFLINLISFFYILKIWIQTITGTTGPIGMVGPVGQPGNPGLSKSQYRKIKRSSI
jgi:hypothetical protein